MSSRKKGKRKGPRDFDVAGSFQGKKMLFTLFKVRAVEQPQVVEYMDMQSPGFGLQYGWACLVKNEVNKPNRYT